MSRHLLNDKPLKQSIRTFLFEEIALGSHTDIYLYSCRLPPPNTDREKRDYTLSGRNWTLTRYVWAHAKHRPFTIIKPIQCADCFRLRTTESKAIVKGEGNDKWIMVEFMCSGCRYKEQHNVSRDMKLLEGAGHLVAFAKVYKWASGTRGEWCWEVMQPAMLGQ
jgi:hypothetical protein